jgi:N-acyl-D-amino-acid deacylase
MRIAWFILVLSILVVGCQCSGPQPGPESSPSSDKVTGTTTSTIAASASASATSVVSSPQQPIEPPGPAFKLDERVALIIRGGTVIDGTGGPPILGDVVIDGDVVLHVGKVAGSVKATKVIDAEGKVVTPGFIDTHAHGDPTGHSRNFLAMGVTTICLGQDGRSPSDDRIRYWKKQVPNRKLAVNVMPFVGHGTIRSLAKVGASKDPTPRQIARMTRMVRRELDDGAWGLTTGLEYTPGRLATREELVEIAKPVAEHDALVMSHMRSEDDDKVEDSVDELVAQGRGSGARVHVSHIKVVYGKGAARAEALLAKLQQARDSGVQITADIYPYNASYTTISILFPGWAKPPASFKRVKRERRDELAEFLRTKVTRRGGPEATLFGTKPFTGMTLKQVAAKMSKPFEDVLIDNIGLGGASAAYFVMDDELQSRLLLDPHVMIGTDGSSYSRHPRGSGTFAKVIAEHVVKRKSLSIVEAVRKMTGLPAHTLRLDEAKRGLLKKGWAADVLVFDPAKMLDGATYEKPSRLASGMSWVILNGRVITDNGKLKKRKAGRLLLKAQSP